MSERTVSANSKPSIPGIIISEMIKSAELPAEETPLGAPVVPEGDETVELDEETPLGPEKEMPKTGETALTFFAAAGALLILMGLLILLQDRKRKNQ